MSKVEGVCYKELLLSTLQDLGEEEFKKFKWLLEIRGIPKNKLERADRTDTVDKIVQKHSQQSTEVVMEILEKIDRNDLVEKLSSSSTETDRDTRDQNRKSSPEKVSLSPAVVKASSEDPIQNLQERDELIKLPQKQHVEEKYDRSEADGIQEESLLESLQKESGEPQEEKHQLIEKKKEGGDSRRKKKFREEIQKTEEIKSPVKEEATAALLDKLTSAKEADTDTVNQTSGKYDYITCKHLINMGSPAVYQLIPKRENIGTLKKLTLGKRDPNKTNRTILLVGETGAGKSTLVNALVNYAIGVEWEDKVWFEIVEEEEKSESDGQDKEEDQSESQTSDVIVYEIFGFEGKTLPYSLTIIDTPGYGDTRRDEQDDIVSQRMLDLFHSEDGVYEINVVGLVLKASDNRLSDRLRYIFDSVASLFGNDMKDNIVSLITHSDGRTPREALKALEAADIKCAQNEKYQPVHFLFNNCQNTERNQKNALPLETSWEITGRGMREFTGYLQNLLPKNLINTAEVLNERITLTASIQNLQQRVELIEKQQTKIKDAQDALNKHREEMKSNEDFTVTVQEPYKEKESIRGGMSWLFFYEGAVCCDVCQENCHYPGCTLAWYPRDCEVFKKSHCTVCTGKCHVSKHVKNKEKYVIKTREVQMTLKDVKEKYKKNKTDWEETKSLSEDQETAEKHLEDLEEAKNTLEEKSKNYDRSKADCEETTGLLADLEKRMKELQAEKDQWLKVSFQHVEKLEQIALNVVSLSTLGHLDFLIEKMNERRDTEKEMFQKEVQKLEKMKSRVGENKTAALQCKQKKPDKAKAK
ncbi:uncharacterized protein LOC117808659 [Notolabrus celidotus]|uniref:uncharacterized protein LOC117808659 n=1 Tax=Notolabrus celidotus TaxID=1203425 RepID=UPI0014903A24|nr:uncharacterized protein LOC117808659 [Notolabrus celidotus]